MTLCVETEARIWDGKAKPTVGQEFTAAVIMAAVETAEYYGGTDQAYRDALRSNLEATVNSSNREIADVSAHMLSSLLNHSPS